MPGKSKLNFIDSLLGGLAQGFQFSQQLKGRKRRLDQFDRQLEFSEGTLNLKRQKQQEAEAFRQRFFNEFTGLGGSQSQTQVPQTPTQGTFDQNIPVQGLGANAEFAGTPAQPATLGTFDPLDLSPRTPTALDEGIQEETFGPQTKQPPPVHSKPLTSAS